MHIIDKVILIYHNRIIFINYYVFNKIKIKTYNKLINKKLKSIKIIKYK